MNKIELCDYRNCTQCYACVYSCAKGAIIMVDSCDGFKIPHIDESVCVGCGACVKSCHRLNGGVNYQKPLKTLACWTKNQKDREKSSSGGAFSVLARKVLGAGGVVYGASMDENLKVRHIGIENASDLILLQGSKYLQSYLGDIYKQVKVQLQGGRQVLFSGTPCQVAGLLTYLKRKYDNLLTCDVVCHGVPSQEAFDVYVEKNGISKNSKYLNFRYTKGWGMQMSTQASHPKETDSKVRPLSPTKNYYFRAFDKGLMFSEACYSCAYARPERVGDISLADFWGIGSKIPFAHPIQKGISMMLVNNEKADRFVSECSDLYSEERTLEEAIEGNHNLSKTSNRPKGRDSYFEDLKNMSVKGLCRKYNLAPSLRDYLRFTKQILKAYFER